MEKVEKRAAGQGVTEAKLQRGAADNKWGHGQEGGHGLLKRVASDERRVIGE